MRVIDVQTCALLILVNVKIVVKKMRPFFKPITFVNVKTVIKNEIVF